jgi:hypothetical protein
VDDLPRDKSQVIIPRKIIVNKKVNGIATKAAPTKPKNPSGSQMI